MERLPVLAVSERGELTSPHERVRELVDAFLSRRSIPTRRAYENALRDFAAFLGLSENDTIAAVGRLLTAGQGEAHVIALKYRTHLLGRKLSPATINQRLSALRSAVKLARLTGLVTWALEVEGEKVQTLRDTRGPGRAGYLLLLSSLGDRQKDARDRAILRLLYDLALRRGEVAGLDLEDVDLERPAVAVLGKGRTGKVLITLPDETRDALAAWLKVRGAAPGALFPSMDRGGKAGGRMTGRGIYEVIRQLGARQGLKVRPHGLRHAAITEALNLTNGDTRKVQRFSRHLDPRTLLHYDDNREDMGGEVSRLVAGAAGR